MSLLSRIRDALRPSNNTPLRNKPGGMAWVRGIATDFGAEQMNGQVVKTVRYDTGGFWEIEPELTFVCTADISSIRHRGLVRSAGSALTMAGLEDEFLEPIKDVGDGEKDESTRWLPPVPTFTKTPDEVWAPKRQVEGA